MKSRAESTSTIPVGLRALAATGLLVGPLGLLGAWAGFRLGAGRGPGEGWTLVHLLLLCSVAALLAAVLGLRGLLPVTGVLGQLAGDAAAGLAVLGVLSFTGQFAIDLAVGSVASDPASMAHLFARVRTVPAMRLAFYGAGPAALYVGLLASVVLLVRGGALGRVAGLVAGAGVGLVGLAQVGAGLQPLYPLGMAGLWAGLLPTSRTLLAGRSPRPRPSGRGTGKAARRAMSLLRHPLEAHGCPSSFDRRQ